MTASNSPDHAKIAGALKVAAFVAVLGLSQYLTIGLYSKAIFVALVEGQWLFQIAQNVKTGHHSSWNLAVVAAVTASNLFYPLYLFGCPHNLAQHSADWIFVALLFGSLALQIALLLSCRLMRDSRWFLPEEWRPVRYQYHRAPSALSGQSALSGLDIATADDDEKEALHKKEDGDGEEHRNCSICLEAVRWREDYQNIMITPCHHFFHDDCLRKWMSHRLNCPTCRMPLPPP